MQNYIPYLWYPGYIESPMISDCPCSAHTYERQRRALAYHVRVRRELCI